MRVSRLVLCSAATFLIGSSIILLGTASKGIAVQHRLLSTTTTTESALLQNKKYSTKDIAFTAPFLRTFHPRLLVYNGSTFQVYNLDHKDTPYMIESWTCGRCGKIIPLLVHALKGTNTILKNNKPFQLLFSDGDSISSKCVNPNTCPNESMAPILLFGSAPTNDDEFPTVQGFPNWFYVKCLYEYKIHGTQTCDWAEPHDDATTLSWNDLIPTVIWRGSDFSFLPDHSEFGRKREAAGIDLHSTTSTKEAATEKLMNAWDDLNPRWRGVALTAKEDVEKQWSDPHPRWIDTKFTGPFGATEQQKFLDLGVQVSTLTKMKPTDMAKYKYQIDYGGGGGTSWRGTMTKLGFPGVLFHHQTPSKDWFFDDMKPWIHYIPIDCHLNDLHDKYLWAESHPVEAETISKAATDLFTKFMGAQYMERIYQELFVEYLGTVVEQYESSSAAGETWEDTIKDQYERGGFQLRLVSECDDKQCHTIYPNNGGADSQPHVADDNGILLATS